MAISGALTASKMDIKTDPLFAKCLTGCRLSCKGILYYMHIFIYYFYNTNTLTLMYSSMYILVHTYTYIVTKNRTF